MYKKSEYITEPIGNNAFSYNERIALWSTGKIFIPSLIQGTVADLEMGSEICFEEVVNNEVRSHTWLKHFVQLTYEGTPVYIIDNHNHALSFRCQNLSDLWTFQPFNLVHIDQHSDSKDNENIFHGGGDIEQFVNEKTNVGNFITAAINSWIIKDVVQVRTDYALQNLWSYDNYILDIDADFRLDKELTENDSNSIRSLIQKAKLVTIATSPYFMDQQKAIEIVKEILI